MSHEQSQWLLDLIIDRLAWLEEDGYVPIADDPRRMGISLSYSSARGRVHVSLDAGRGDIEIWLAPPKQGDPEARIDSSPVARES